jgi:hypothetical protein
MGGLLLEAAVKSTKFHLKRVIGDTLLNYEKLYTLLSMIKACLNSQPITPLSTDGATRTRRQQPTQQSVIPITIIGKIAPRFLETVVRRVLHQLQQRTKWNTTIQQPQVDSLVLLREDNIPALQWILGRITTLHPEADRLTRVLSVKTVRGVVKRPVTKVCVDSSRLVKGH